MCRHPPCETPQVAALARAWGTGLGRARKRSFHLLAKAATSRAYSCPCSCARKSVGRWAWQSTQTFLPPSCEGSYIGGFVRCLARKVVSTSVESGKGFGSPSQRVSHQGTKPQRKGIHSRSSSSIGGSIPRALAIITMFRQQKCDDWFQRNASDVNG